VSTVRAGEPGASGPVPIPAVFIHLVDDTTLLAPRAEVPPMAEVVKGYLSARDGDYAGLLGQLVCPVSRVPELVTELARAAPPAPVEVALVVDTGLGAVPKALSLVLARGQLLTPCAVETAAPNDLDATWLERVSEFVPEDVQAVIEPRRPLCGDTRAWLDAVRRVADQGASPKLRCGGPRPSDVPTPEQVTDFLAAADTAPAGFTASLGLRNAVRRQDDATGATEHGLLNMVAAVARSLVGGDARAALDERDSAVLVREIAALSDTNARAVRGLLSRCGCGATEQTALELTRHGVL
jgi:hypothetical protein